MKMKAYGRGIWPWKKVRGEYFTLFSRIILLMQVVSGCRGYVQRANLKCSLLGSFYGMSGKYLQEYFDEFCYRAKPTRPRKATPLTLAAPLVSFFCRCSNLPDNSLEAVFIK
jgi:hypothetical protein